MDSSAAGFHLWLTVDTDGAFLRSLSRPSLPIILPGTMEQHTVCHPTKDHGLPWLVLGIVFNVQVHTSAAALKPWQTRLNPTLWFPWGRIYKGRHIVEYLNCWELFWVSRWKWRLGGTTVHWVPVKLLFLSPERFQSAIPALPLFSSCPCL